MALSGVTNKTYTTKGAYWIWVEWSATQNITNNTSTVTANLYMGTNSYGYVNFTRTNKAAVRIDGTWLYFDTVIVGKNTTKKLIGTASKVVDHNSAGAKTLAVSGWYHHDASSTNFQLTIPSQNFTLNTIARASTPTVNYSSRPIGSTVRISTNAASSSFRHTIHYRLGNWSSNIATGVSSYFDWAPPKALALQMTNTTSRAGTITLYTYASNGGAHIGTKTVAFTTTVPNSGEYLASVSTPTAAISGSRADKTMGKYIQNYSKVDMAFNAYAGYGATVTGRTIRITGGPDNMPVHATSGTSGTLTGFGTYTITGYVTDSRGRTANSGSSRTITVHAYTAPRITNFTAIRNATTPTTVNTTRAGTYTTLGGSNALTAITARRPTGGAWTDLDISSKFGTYASTGNSDAQSFDFRLTITDTLGQSAQSVITVSTGKVALSIREDIGIGAGKVHERGALDVGGDIHAEGFVSADGGFAVKDTRNIVDTPEGIARQALSMDFKRNASVGNPPVTAHGSYSHILNLWGWDGPSGGWPTQLSFGDGLAVRQGVSETTWGSWRELYHSGNTGGITSGSNSNGYWTMYPDGTLLQHSSAKWFGTLKPGVTEYTWTFPKPFVDVNYTVIGSPRWSGGSTAVPQISMGFSSMWANRALVAVQNPRSGDSNANPMMIAVGRWK